MSVRRGSFERAVGLVNSTTGRLELIASGAIPVGIAAVMINIRFNGVWSRGALLLVALLGCAAALCPGIRAERESEHPRPAHTALLVAGLLLMAVVLLRLAQVLGVDRPLGASGTLTWMAAVFAGVAAFPAWGRLNSPACALMAAIGFGVALLAFVDWVFDPRGLTTSRWVLLVLILLCSAAHVRERRRRPRHAVQMVNAGGVAALVLTLSFAIQLVVSIFLHRAGHGPSVWWELVIFAAGTALVAYAVGDRERGPAYLGLAVLLAFTAVAGLRSPAGASLLGWPLVLLAIGGALLGIAIRPRLRERPRSSAVASSLPMRPATDTPTDLPPPAA
jgi:hypothetical protein